MNTEKGVERGLIPVNRETRWSVVVQLFHFSDSSMSLLRMLKNLAGANLVHAVRNHLVHDGAELDY